MKFSILKIFVSLVPLFVVAENTSEVVDVSDVILHTLGNINGDELTKLEEIIIKIKEIELDKLNPHLENVAVILTLIMVSILFCFKLYKKISKVVKSKVTLSN